VVLQWEIVDVVIAITSREVQENLVRKVWDRFTGFNARFVKVCHQFGIDKEVIPSQIPSSEIQSVMPELIKVIPQITMGMHMNAFDVRLMLKQWFDVFV
jgi:hypothetical protein